jgi:hypothetical protein
MKHNPVNCRYFYGDYHRGKNKESCRLLESSPDNTRRLRRALCNTCPVPELIIASNTRDLALEAKIQRKFFSERVEVTFAVCTRHMEELDDPHYCPKCAAEAE